VVRILKPVEISFSILVQRQSAPDLGGQVFCALILECLVALEEMSFTRPNMEGVSADLPRLSTTTIPVCKGKHSSVLIKAALSKLGGKSTQVGKTHFAATGLDPQETRIRQEFLLLRQVGRRRALANPKRRQLCLRLPFT
jgi:hypothetical protein